MLNWSIDEKKLRKDPKKYNLWRVTQLINYGLGKEKLAKAELKRVWPKIKENLDPYKKRALEYLLWKRVYSLPNNLNFWNLPKASRR